MNSLNLEEGLFPEQFFSSQDGATLLRVVGSQATTIDAVSKEEISMLDLRGPAISATISNHRAWVAAALETLLATDIYQYKREGEKWSMVLLQRLRGLVQSVQWEETDDSRYPPTELKVEKRDGTTMILMPK